jgi:hypothetical protein
LDAFFGAFFAGFFAFLAIYTILLKLSLERGVQYRAQPRVVSSVYEHARWVSRRFLNSLSFFALARCGKGSAVVAVAGQHIKARALHAHLNLVEIGFRFLAMRRID